MPTVVPLLKVFQGLSIMWRWDGGVWKATITRCSKQVITTSHNWARTAECCSAPGLFLISVNVTTPEILWCLQSEFPLRASMCSKTQSCQMKSKLCYISAPGLSACGPHAEGGPLIWEFPNPKSLNNPVDSLNWLDWGVRGHNVRWKPVVDSGMQCQKSIPKQLPNGM